MAESKLTEVYTDDNAATAGRYQPDADEQALIAKVDEDFQVGRRNRLPYEGQWYVNSAMIRGQQRVIWDYHQQQLVTPPAPSHRIRRSFNIIFPKVRARQAKFLKNRTKPIVRPATTDVKDILDARITTKALEFARRRLQLERKYQLALQWAMQTGHGYWWFSWDPDALAKIRLNDPATGGEVVELGKAGEVEVEVGSPFEVIIGDSNVYGLADQPWIQRIKVRPLTWVRARYPEKGQFVKAETTEDESFRYERATGSLSPAHNIGFTLSDAAKQQRDKQPAAIVKERFERPSGKYPMGRYTVVAGGVLLKHQDELPYGMWDMPNPYPVTDFPDTAFGGQYWITTVVEQAIPLQQQYNVLRSKVEEHLKLMIHPKLLVAKQHQIPVGAWSNQSGEMVEYQAHPGIPPPQTWNPPNVSGDVWRTLEMLQKEIDTIFHIYPEAEGRVGAATSGFQTNLLQEATDAVHAPDVRAHEMAMEEAAFKIRRIMKRGYDVPRLVSITTNDSQVEAFEFSAEDIDDNADIIIEAGSALPDLKGAKIQMALELRNSRIFGNPDDPEVNRKVLSMLDMGDLSSIYADARRDEERARLENIDFEKGGQADPPLFCDNHDIHSRVHTDQLKSAAFKDWSEASKIGLIDHILWHAVFINPSAAAQIAAIYSRPVPQLPQVQPVMGPGGQPPQGGPPQTQPGGGPQGPPPPGAPPEAVANGNVQAVPGGGFGPQGGNGSLPPV